MKAYTNIVQSKKLAEILPFKSADMFFCNDGSVKLMWEHLKNIPVTTPCWSLAALLDILICPSLHKTFGGWRCDSYNKEGTSYILGKPSDNPVDACVDMILKLKEMNLL